MTPRVKRNNGCYSDSGVSAGMSFFGYFAKVKQKKTQLVERHREKLAKKYSSVNKRIEPSFFGTMLNIAILACIIALIWYLI